AGGRLLLVHADFVSRTFRARPDRRRRNDHSFPDMHYVVAGAADRAETAGRATAHGVCRTRAGRLVCAAIPNPGRWHDTPRGRARVASAPLHALRLQSASP